VTCIFSLGPHSACANDVKKQAICMWYASGMLLHAFTYKTHPLISGTAWAYSVHHKPNNHPQENAFQYVLWEIGNDFNGSIHSISETSGRVKPSIDSTFAPEPRLRETGLCDPHAAQSIAVLGLRGKCITRSRKITQEPRPNKKGPMALFY
jgi:hypothetical protein